MSNLPPTPLYIHTHTIILGSQHLTPPAPGGGGAGAGAAPAPADVSGGGSTLTTGKINLFSICVLICKNLFPFQNIYIYKCLTQPHPPYTYILSYR